MCIFGGDVADVGSGALGEVVVDGFASKFGLADSSLARGCPEALVEFAREAKSEPAGLLSQGGRPPLRPWRAAMSRAIASAPASVSRSPSK